MSTAMEAMFAGRIHQDGHALRRTTLRHTNLTDPALGICLWRLGGERFRAAAVAWGPIGGPYKLAVAGEPRNRDLYFSALLPFAADLCKRIRRVAATQVARQRGRHTDYLPADALQIVVPNRTTVAALGLLGRYLAYLSDRGGVAPDPALVEAGKHLRFYARHARVPGQALLVPLDRLLAEHWATLLSPFEQANLAAVDAQIDPPRGVHAFDSGFAAEASARIGPEPTEDIDRITDELLARFNEARGGATEPATIGPLIAPIEAHYRRLVDPVWALMARVVDRERALPAAPSVPRRFEVDREAFGRRVDWVTGGGRYRTTDTPRQAAMTLRRLEEPLARYEAEKAIEDPAAMVPYLLDGEAVRGVVASLNDQYRVRFRVKAVRRAIIALDTDDPVILPLGKKLWWTATAHDHHWEVQDVTANGAGSRITLMLYAAPTPARLPGVGDRITFSVLHTSSDGYRLPPPQNPPWTHTSAAPPAPPEPIDAGDGDPPAAAVDGATLPDPGVYA
ncbi:MAG TPA: hypothetical protein VFA11_05135 [Acidimicrobiales bacterium]|nr:hypothetical protein [Acidimicrobiales bacterium]